MQRLQPTAQCNIMANQPEGMPLCLGQTQRGVCRLAAVFDQLSIRKATGSCAMSERGRRPSRHTLLSGRGMVRFNEP